MKRVAARLVVGWVLILALSGCAASRSGEVAPSATGGSTPPPVGSRLGPEPCEIARLRIGPGLDNLIEPGEIPRDCLSSRLEGSHSMLVVLTTRRPRFAVNSRIVVIRIPEGQGSPVTHSLRLWQSEAAPHLEAVDLVPGGTEELLVSEASGTSRDLRYAVLSLMDDRVDVLLEGGPIRHGSVSTDGHTLIEAGDELTAWRWREGAFQSSDVTPMPTEMDSTVAYSPEGEELRLTEAEIGLTVGARVFLDGRGSADGLLGVVTTDDSVLQREYGETFIARQPGYAEIIVVPHAAAAATRLRVTVQSLY